MIFDVLQRWSGEDFEKAKAEAAVEGWGYCYNVISRVTNDQAMFKEHPGSLHFVSRYKISLGVCFFLFMFSSRLITISVAAS